MTREVMPFLELSPRPTADIENGIPMQEMYENEATKALDYIDFIVENPARDIQGYEKTGSLHLWLNAVASVQAYKYKNSKLTRHTFGQYVDDSEIVNRFNLANLKNIAMINTILSENAQAQLCAKLGIPFSYVRKCADREEKEVHKLCATNIFTHLSHYDKPLLFRCIKRNDGSFLVRAVLSQRYYRMDVPIIAEGLRDFTREVYEKYNVLFELRTIYSSPYWFHCRLISTTPLGTASATKDPVFPGLFVTSSDCGLSSFKVQFGLYRQVCTNGMVVATESLSITRRHLGTSEPVCKLDAGSEFIDRYLDLVDMSETAWDNLSLRPKRDLYFMQKGDYDYENYESPWQELYDRDLSAYVPSLGKRDRLEVRESIPEDALPFDIVNAVTQYAHVLPFEQRLAVEQEAGRLMVYYANLPKVTGA